MTRGERRKKIAMPNRERILAHANRSIDLENQIQIPKAILVLIAVMIQVARIILNPRQILVIQTSIKSEARFFSFRRGPDGRLSTNKQFLFRRYLLLFIKCQPCLYSFALSRGMFEVRGLWSRFI